MATEFTWSLGETKIKITGETPTPIWSYGVSTVYFEYVAVAAGGNIIRDIIGGHGVIPFLR